MPRRELSRRQRRGSLTSAATPLLPSAASADATPPPTRSIQTATPSPQPTSPPPATHSACDMVGRKTLHRVFQLAATLGSVMLGIITVNETLKVAEEWGIPTHNITYERKLLWTVLISLLHAVRVVDNLMLVFEHVAERGQYGNTAVDYGRHSPRPPLFGSCLASTLGCCLNLLLFTACLGKVVTSSLVQFAALGEFLEIDWRQYPSSEHLQRVLTMEMLLFSRLTAQFSN